MSEVNRQDSTRVICLTGQMAAGKNYIASQLTAEEDCTSIDLDQTVHTVIEQCTDEIFNTFKDSAQTAGISLTNQDGTLDRRALGKLLFSNPELLAKQEQIVYPKVITLTKEFIEENIGKTILINATVLFKTPELMELCDQIYFVTAPCLKRLIRAKKRDKMPLIQIIKRFNSQKHLLAAYKSTGKPVILIKN